VTPATWLGDVVRAVAAETPPGTTPYPELVRKIARLLGVDLGQHHAAADAEPASVLPPDRLHATEMAGPPWPEQAPAATERVVRRSRATGEAEEREQDPMAGLRRSWVEVPDQPWATDAVPDLPRITPEQLVADPPHEPLLRRATTSAIVQALLSRHVPDDEIDVPALVEQTASARAVRELPRLPRPTLRYGAHVLVDQSEGMSLFWRDQQTLLDAIRGVVGEALTGVSVLDGSPRRMRRGHLDPEPGRAVLVLAGFGIRWGRVERNAWENYVARLRQRECRVAALVPFPRDRWPGWLTSLMPVVCWDRVTTVGAVRAALGKAS
jgi:hypothetical protein